MKKSEAKKEIIAAYKEKKSVGGVYIIRNITSGKIFIDMTPNMQGMLNRFEFAKKTKTPFTIKFQSEWQNEKDDAFEIEILEEIEMGVDQTRKSFKEDLETMKNLWKEKFSGNKFY